MRKRSGTSDFNESPELFFLYRLAEEKHVTVAELLTGEKQPITVAEFYMWSTYFSVKEELRKYQEAQSR